MLVEVFSTGLKEFFQSSTSKFTLIYLIFQFSNNDVKLYVKKKILLESKVPNTTLLK